MAWPAATRPGIADTFSPHARCGRHDPSSLQRMDRSATAAERAADAAREAAVAAQEAAKETGRIADAVIEMIRKFTQREAGAGRVTPILLVRRLRGASRKRIFDILRG